MAMTLSIRKKIADAKEMRSHSRHYCAAVDQTVGIILLEFTFFPCSKKLSVELISVCVVYFLFMDVT